MDWALIVSISLNVVGVLTYFKLPEMIQGLILQKVEYKYKNNISILSKYQEVLPELFEKAALSHSHYGMNYDGLVLNLNTMKEYAELKNYITIKQFFMPEKIKKTAREVEILIFDYVAAKHKETTESLPNKKSEELNKKISALMDRLESEIYEALKNKY